jgi:hypothetical protein
MSGKVRLTGAAASGSFLAGRRCRNSFLEWRDDDSRDVIHAAQPIVERWFFERWPPCRDLTGSSRHPTHGYADSPGYPV